MRKILIGIMVLILLVSYACKKEKPSSQKVDYITRILMDHIQSQKALIQEGVKQRAEKALSLWQNGITEHNPILILACLGKDYKTNEYDMILTIFDEDGDVIGFIVNEEHYDSNNIVSELKEEYPVYIHCLPLEIANIHLIPVKIRTEMQRKDEVAWKNYIDCDYGRQLDEYLKKQDKLNDPKLPEEFWINSLPTVWISRPESKKVKIYISIYDKEGNKSESVELVELPQSIKKNSAGVP